MPQTAAIDQLSKSALESLSRAEAIVRRRLAADLEQEGLSHSGFTVLMILSESGGELELRRLRERLGTSKANATEVVTTLEQRGFVGRFRLAHDRRAASVRLSAAGRRLVNRLAPEHTRRVSDAFSCLDRAEQQALADICAKLAA
ncbi:MAG: MarR family transcriptional regulator [Baekduia sp.]